MTVKNKRGAVVDPLPPTSELNGTAPAKMPETAPAASVLPASPPDPFDPAKLRLSQDFGAIIGIKKALLTVPVRKPSKEWWIRVRPEPEYRLQTGILELREDREIYLTAPDLWPELSAESTFGPRALFTGMNRQGVLFLWPIRLPGADGRIDDWNRSALESTSIAAGKWVRITANMSLGAYDTFETAVDLPAPEWPALSFAEILKVAFKDKYIGSLDHPVLRRLRGEI